MVRSARGAKVLFAIAGALLTVAGILGFLNSQFGDSQAFSEHINNVRKDPAVSARAGESIAHAVIDAKPDLIAIEPAIAAGSAAVVGSDALDNVFTSTISSFHEALTQRDADSAVLALADFGATLATALSRLMPDVAASLPDDLNATLAEFGGQHGVAEYLIPVLETISTLAWVVPALALVLIAVAFWLSPSRRRGFLRLGWTVFGAGLVVGLVSVIMLTFSALADQSTTSGAITAATLAEFARPLAIRAISVALIGGLVVVAASALLPQVDIVAAGRRLLAWAGRRPESPLWALVRALVILAAGLAVVALPTLAAQLVAVVAGLVLLFVGVTELDIIAERYRSADLSADAAATAVALDAAGLGPVGARPAARASRARGAIPLAAGLCAVALLAVLIIPDQLPQPTGAAGAQGSTTACNGHDELCDRPFDQVVIPASHNSMSVADGTWFLAEQPKDMVDSLDDGIRGLLVDTWYGQATETGGAITAEKSVEAAEAELAAQYGPDVVDSIRRTIDRVRNETPVGPVEPYFCHTVCEIGATQMLGVMKRLREWFDAHPREVVVLFIQDAVTPQDTAEVLTEAGLTDLTYTHPSGSAWPTLEQMIDDNQRLVVLMEKQSGGSEYPYLQDGFDLVQDTEYTFHSVDDFTCTLKRGSPESPLFMVNHWLASFTSLVSSAKLVNARDVLDPRISECEEVRGRTPTMIAVNWYNFGDLFAVVDELNGVA